MPEQGKCRSCGAAIIWCQTLSGNLMPLNAEPDEKGNMAIIDGKATQIVVSLYEPVHDGPKYTSHFATCPDYAQWRKKKR